MNFFYVKKTEFYKERKTYGITWESFPSFVILTSNKQAFFPLAQDVHLGDGDTVEKVFENHIDDFFKFRLTPIYRQPESPNLLERDKLMVEKLGNTRTIRKNTFAKVV
mmetsp:Transcript_1614/g.1547  ORF Transcript_1614/g.1547 Transcript_1614/m.1547 type:complete len:108 (+) Transcript_1614:309-632(+)